MTIALLRVDERLIHGQVTVGWGTRLNPSHYVVVDEELAHSDWEAEILALGAPPGTSVSFVTPNEGRQLLEVWHASPEVFVVLTRDLGQMVRLLEATPVADLRVNLGGMHHRPGRREFLPYIYLDEEDLRHIQDLLLSGIEVSARDLPGSHGRDASGFLTLDHDPRA